MAGRLVRPIVAGVVLLALVAGGGWLFWARDPGESGYPFAPGVPGQVGALWSLAPEQLDRATAADITRLGQALDRLDAAMAQVEARKDLLSAEKIDGLRLEDRQAIRALWADVLDPLLALDDIKHRYGGFWGIDYKAHPQLHARSFGLTFAALCAEVEAGQTLVRILGSAEVAPSLFDEAMADYGLPAGTFSAFRKKLVRSRDLSYVPIGDGWFHLWNSRNLEKSDGVFASLVTTRARRAKEALGPAGVVSVVRNKGDILQKEAFERWFPVQKEVSEWAGDTRVVDEHRRLISDAQIADMRKAMKPGDVIVERRNWYLSNVGLPGFWPHAALFVGTPDEIRAAFDDDAETNARYGKFSEHLAKTHPKAWASLAGKDAQGHPHAILEAVSEGVVTSSVEHSCGADYVAALRPRLPLVEIAAAMERAFTFFGRPYDFNFDFGTDDQVVCSELVIKAYEPKTQEGPGLRIPFIAVAGRRAVPPTELVRTFGAELGKDARQLDFVYFLDGRERGQSAIVGDEASLAKTATRPKWDIVQP
jgi:Permuted papain-like amidase enzyme, YaeF/YiiX, C92 family